MLKRCLSLAALVLVAACAPKSQVLPDDTAEFAQYRHIGCAPLSDRTGRGPQVAEAIETSLEHAGYEPVDHKALVDILDKNKPDKQLGLDLEGVEYLRNKAGADAVVFGRMASDWSFASITVVDLEVGNPVLHAILRPRKAKTFANPQEVADEFIRVYSKLK